MGPDDITSDTHWMYNQDPSSGVALVSNIPISSGGVYLGPRYSVNLDELAMTSTAVEIDWGNAEARAALHSAFVTTTEPMIISSTPNNNDNLFMEMVRNLTVNELIADTPDTMPVASGSYFVDREARSPYVSPGTTLPYDNTQVEYRMGLQADSPQAVTDTMVSEGLSRLSRLHRNDLADELRVNTDHISYTVENAVESARRLEGVECVFDLDARAAAQREMLNEATSDTTVPIGNMIMPIASVMRAIDEELESQQVCSLTDFCEEDGMIHVRNPEELEALKQYIEVTNPRLYMSYANPYIFKVFNSKYTYVAQAHADGQNEPIIEYSVYDRYGKYTIPEFLSFNRDEPEYRDICERIRNTESEEEGTDANR